MKFGELDLTIVSDGEVRLDGGAMFGVVPKPLWSRKIAADERNRITLAMNVPVIRVGGKILLIETGVGEKTDAKFNDIYGVHRPTGLVKALEGLGIQPEDVDVVINTHLHFDHCGGNTRRDDDGKIVATFPNAEYIVQKGEYEHALSPTERDRASYLPENYHPLAENGQLRLIEGEGEILPGVEVVRVPGHTPDQQCVRVHSGGQTAFFFADLIPTAAHLPYPWIMAYDLNPLTTLEEKKQWIPQAVENRWLCLFAHDPNLAAGYLTEREGKVAVEPAAEAGLVQAL